MPRMSSTDDDPDNTSQNKSGIVGTLIVKLRGRNSHVTDCETMK